MWQVAGVRSLEVGDTKEIVLSLHVHLDPDLFSLVLGQGESPWLLTGSARMHIHANLRSLNDALYTIATGNRKRVCISMGTHSKLDIDVTISQLRRACGRVVHDLQHSRCGLVL